MAPTDFCLNNLFFILGCFLGDLGFFNTDCEQSKKYDQFKTQEVSEENPCCGTCNTTRT